jgi:hypothetical protein
VRRDCGGPLESAEPSARSNGRTGRRSERQARLWHKAEVRLGRRLGHAELCAREKCSARQVNMTMSLAFLAPNLVKAAAEARLPRGLGIERLRDLPSGWGQQFDDLGQVGQRPGLGPSEVCALPPCVEISVPPSLEMLGGDQPGLSPSASNCRLHSVGGSRNRSTPTPRGKRPCTAALIRLGARKASEIVILTCRTLHFSRRQS